MFYQDRWQKYIHAERVAGDPSGGITRGEYGNVCKYLDFIAEKGLTKPAFTNVGRWHRGQEAERDAPVFLPWIYIDIDCERDIVAAANQADEVIQNLYYYGYDPERIFVSYSGRKGFHVQISTLQAGRPIFVNSIAANVFVKTFTEDVASGLDWDPAVTNPKCLIRATGSKHEDTGFYKRTWLAEDFKQMNIHARFKNLDQHRPFRFNRSDEIWAEPRKHFAEISERTKIRLDKMERHEPGDGGEHEGRGIIDRLRSGVEESEEWGDKHFHIGRENAAYVMGCWYLERYSERLALKRLRGWNRRNDPPLPLNRLKAQFRGAKRTIYD